MPKKEYIERESVEKIIKKLYQEPKYQHTDEDFYAGVCAVAGGLATLPTADVAEVKHGEWIKTDNIPNKDHILVECSLCHSGHYLKKFLNDSNGEQTYKHHCETVHFCSSCGAKMNGKGKGKV